MREEKLEKLLGELAEGTAEAVSPHLAEDIKQQIPQQLHAHRGGMNTVNIIIDLRINKLVAAAAIIITTIFLVNFFGGRGSRDAGIYQDGKLLLSYIGGADVGRSNVLENMAKLCESLASQGKDVVYYGDISDPEDSNAILMQWRLRDNRYRVVFCDLRETEVNAEELIKLQSQMLQARTK